MTSENIDKTLTGIESLCELMLERCYKARKELGLVQASTRPTGLSEKEILKLVSRRREVVKNQNKKRA